MKPKNVIVWILLLGIVVLTMSTSVQAKVLTEINATDILKQIENEENIYLENVRITGELNLSKIELKASPIARSKWEISHYGLEGELKIVESKIEILNSSFVDDVDFSNTLFRKNIDFSGTSFGEINFRGADFSDYAYFVDVIFRGDAKFEQADFSGDAYFWDAKFSGDAYFRGAKFSGDADFSDAVFSSDANFSNAVFSGYTYFNSTKFNKVSFTKGSFTNVSLAESDFNRMNVEWNSLEDALVFDGPTYIKLIRKFREIEQFEDADAAYYQYRRLSQAKKSGLSQS